MAIIEFEYKGEKYEADDSLLKSYVKLKHLAQAKNDPTKAFEVFSDLFAGHDEEYAEKLGDSMEEMGNLCAEAMKAMSEKK